MRYVVVGMHKSGTTLIARLLHHAGISMVAQVSDASYEADNFYEREASYQLNLRLLNEAHDFLELHPPPQQVTINDEIRRDMKALVQVLDTSHAQWGFKDPRTCLVYDAWRTHLGDHRLIVTYRPVYDMWHRFVYTGYKFWRNLRNAVRLVQRWCEYNSAILTILSNTTIPYVVISFPQLLSTDSELDRLQDFVGLALSDEREKRAYISQHSRLITIAITIVKHTMGYDYHHIYAQLDGYRRLTSR